MRLALPLLCAALCLSCFQRELRASPTRRVVQLVEAVEERETLTFTEVRGDLEIDTRDHDRTPRVVATAETGLLRLDGAQAQLFGDADGTLGWSVDNVLLFEVLDRAGAVRSRFAAGFSDPLMLGKEHVDNLGRQSFAFGPGEIDLTGRLPEGEPFRLRCTALDHAMAGRVSDVFLVLTPSAETLEAAREP